MGAVIWQSSLNLVVGSQAWDARQIPLSMGNIQSVTTAPSETDSSQNAGQFLQATTGQSNLDCSLIGEDYVSADELCQQCAVDGCSSILAAYTL